MSALGYILGIPALIAISAIWRGYVLTILWAWFIVPTFSLPALHIAPAIGMSLVVGFLVADTRKHDDSERPGAFLHAAVMAVIYPALMLLVGWVVQHWMPA